MLSFTALHASIKDPVEGYHIDIVDEVKVAVSANRLVVVGMRYNDAVYGARKALKKLVLSLLICSAAAMHRSGDGPWHLKCG